MSKVYNSNQAKFDNTKPQKAGPSKVDFCKYWTGTWKDMKTFTIPGKPVASTPLDFTKKEYASKTNEFNDEFVWLQKELNAPAKAQVSLSIFHHLVSIVDPTPL